jgi:hypothetical protein
MGEVIFCYTELLHFDGHKWAEFSMGFPGASEKFCTPD